MCSSCCAKGRENLYASTTPTRWCIINSHLSITNIFLYIFKKNCIWSFRSLQLMEILSYWVCNCDVILNYIDRLKCVLSVGIVSISNGSLRGFVAHNRQFALKFNLAPSTFMDKCNIIIMEASIYKHENLIEHTTLLNYLNGRLSNFFWKKINNNKSRMNVRLIIQLTYYFNLLNDCKV